MIEISRPKLYWYGYVRETIRHYPDRIPDSDAGRRAKKAVEEAVRVTQADKDGKARMQLIGMVFFEKTHTFSGAARRTHISERTAQRWISDFVYLVAKNIGF